MIYVSNQPASVWPMEIFETFKTLIIWDLLHSIPLLSSETFTNEDFIEV